MSDLELKIGADPEFFVLKDGKPVSAYGLIEGTKKAPIPVKDGAIQVDGMALEFNINPATTKKEFSSNIQSVLNQFREIIPKEYEFSFTPVAEFGEQYIAEQPEEARRLGCDPDFNAWTGDPNPTPNANGSFRTASGHIHLGWTENQDINDPEHIEACQMMTKQLDVVLGMASVVWDPDNRRRELYGKAGAFRPKPYGVEYRTMSNVWVNVPWMRDFIFDAAKLAFNELMRGTTWYQGRYVSPNGLQEIINIGDWKTGYVTSSGFYYDETGMLSGVYEERVNAEKRLLALKKSEALKAVKNTPNPAKYNEQVAQAIIKRQYKKKPLPPKELDLNNIQPVVAPDPDEMAGFNFDALRNVPPPRPVDWAMEIARAEAVIPPRRRARVVNVGGF